MERVVDKDCTIKITRKEEQIWFSTIPAGSKINISSDNKLTIEDKAGNSLLAHCDCADKDMKVFLDDKELSLTSETPRKKKVEGDLNG